MKLVLDEDDVDAIIDAIEYLQQDLFRRSHLNQSADLREVLNRVKHQAEAQREYRERGKGT